MRWMKHTMVTSSNGNSFRVTGHLCGEFTSPRLTYVDCTYEALLSTTMQICNFWYWHIHTHIYRPTSVTYITHFCGTHITLQHLLCYPLSICFVLIFCKCWWYMCVWFVTRNDLIIGNVCVIMIRYRHETLLWDTGIWGTFKIFWRFLLIDMLPIGVTQPTVAFQFVSTRRYIDMFVMLCHVNGWRFSNSNSN